MACVKAQKLPMLEGSEGPQLPGRPSLLWHQNGLGILRIVAVDVCMSMSKARIAAMLVLQLVHRGRVAQELGWV